MIGPSTEIALHRFGLGARYGEVEAVGDPLDWLDAQIAAAPATPRFLEPYGSSVAAWNELRIYKARANKSLRTMSGGDYRRAVRRSYEHEIGNRIRHAIVTPDHFTERLVWFWSNHFTVSTALGAHLLGPHATALEREAIRPHVFGRFRDMLVAVARQPAMLVYLDNHLSVGPHSETGRALGRGLNENFGRELLELHTLGVDGGYEQDDVTALSKILTGWRPSDDLLDPEIGSAFRFDPLAHEPGAKRLLGVSFAEDGEAEGLAALDMLVARPETARFVATKLVRHFIADEPPAADVDALAETFMETAGDLAAVARRLVRLEAAWRPGPAKLRTPAELLVAVWRALGTDPTEKWVNPLRLLRNFDNMPFGAPSPAGWPDIADAWLGPHAVLGRFEWCAAAAERGVETVPAPPLEWARDVLGARLGPDLERRVAAEPEPAMALAMVMVSPEFQWR